MARGRKASVTTSRIACLVYGQPFTGKSTMALQTAYLKNPDGSPFKVLYLDPESGSVDDYLETIEADGINLDNIYIVYTQSMKEVRDYIKKAKNNEEFYELDDDGVETEELVLDADGNPFKPDVIVVDGTTILNLTTKQGLVEFSKKRAKVKAEKNNLIGDEKFVKVEGSGLELKDYQTINFKGQDLVLDLMGCGKHFVITAREVDEKVTKEINGTSTSVATGKKIPEGFKGMDYNVKTLIRMYRDEDKQVKAFVEKDRTNVHPNCATLDDPTMLDWQSIIDKSKGKKDFVIHNNLSESVKLEHEVYKNEVLNPQEKQTLQSDTDKKATDIKELVSEIDAKIKSLPPNKKAQMKTMVKESGLPADYKKVTDVDVLKKLLEAIDKNS